MLRRTALIGLLGLVAGMLVILEAPAVASCPARKAGRLSTENHPDLMSGYAVWSANVPDRTINIEEGAMLDLALMVPTDGSMNVYVSNGSTNFVTLTFGGGTVIPGGVDFPSNKWNNVRVEINFDADSFRVTVNGETSTFQPFTGSSSEIKELTFEATVPDGTEHFWIDSIKFQHTFISDSFTFFTENFQTDPPAAGYGTMTAMTPTTMEAGEGASCPTKITLALDKSPSTIEATGKVTPKHPGGEVEVRLFKKVGGTFDLVRKKTDELSAQSHYATSFARPNANRCKIEAKFLADDDHTTSSATKTFDC